MNESVAVWSVRILPQWHNRTQNKEWKEQENKIVKRKNAPAGNRTRVCTVAGYYSTTRPLVLLAADFGLSTQDPCGKNADNEKTRKPARLSLICVLLSIRS